MDDSERIMLLHKIMKLVSGKTKLCTGIWMTLNQGSFQYLGWYFAHGKGNYFLPANCSSNNKVIIPSNFPQES